MAADLDDVERVQPPPRSHEGMTSEQPANSERTTNERRTDDEQITNEQPPNDEGIASEEAEQTKEEIETIDEIGQAVENAAANWDDSDLYRHSAYE